MKMKQIWWIFHAEKKNVIHERAIFYMRTQKDRNPIEKFIRGLYELAEHWFPSKNDQIRDCLVIGLRNKDLYEKLQLKEDLS